jgi:CubicO group peptidase (beta-lactamase class C family)
MMLEDRIKKVDQMLHDKAFNGSVLIAYKSKVLWSKGYGFADFELDVPIQPQTKLRIASITKTITAVAIMQLIEKELLRLDDPLSKFIPDYPNGEKITVKHLLTHSSGIRNFELDMDFYEIEHASSFSEKLIDLFKYEPLQFDPGTAFSYSVSGYFLLGYMIERVTGLSYTEYLKLNIFEPLHMENSGFDDAHQIIKGRAKNYEMEGSILRNSHFFDMRIAGAGGGLYSTVEDLYRLQMGLLNHQLISRESDHQMNTNQIQINEQTHYGFGLFLAEAEICGKNRHKNYHSGGGPGVRSIMAYYPDDQLLCIMISNINDKHIFNDAHALMEEILFTE